MEEEPPLPKFSSELMQAIEADATECYNLWKYNSTEEEKQAGKSDLKSFQTDEDYRRERMEKSIELFERANFK